MGRKSVSKTPLGQRLTEVREARGYLKRADFAAFLEMNPETLGGYERGDTEPDINFLVMYRRKFDVNLDWLMTGEGEMFNDPVLNRLRKKSRDARKNKTPIDPDLLLRVADALRQAHEEADVKVPRNSDIRPLAEFYNDMMIAGVDMNDEASLSSRLEEIKAKVSKMLQKAKKEPGTGKRSASSS